MNGLLVIGLAASGCNTYLAVILLSLAVGVHGAVSTGPLSACVDLSPNFAGVILGINGMIGVIPGFISPILVGILTLNNVRSCKNQQKTVYLFKTVFLFLQNSKHKSNGNTSFSSQLPC